MIGITDTESIKRELTDFFRTELGVQFQYLEDTSRIYADNKLHQTSLGRAGVLSTFYDFIRQKGLNEKTVVQCVHECVPQEPASQYLRPDKLSESYDYQIGPIVRGVASAAQIGQRANAA